MTAVVLARSTRRPLPSSTKDPSSFGGASGSSCACCAAGSARSFSPIPFSPTSPVAGDSSLGMSGSARSSAVDDGILFCDGRWTTRRLQLVSTVWPMTSIQCICVLLVLAAYYLLADTFSLSRQKNNEGKNFLVGGQTVRREGTRFGINHEVEFIPIYIALICTCW